MRRRSGILLALLLAGGLAATIAILSATQEGPLPFGALGPPPDAGGVCIPARQGQAFDGTNALRNSGANPIEIEDVRLVEARGLRIEGAYVAPILHTSLIGTVPPTTPAAPGYAAWQQRKSASGATILPGQEINLVLVLGIGREVGDARGGVEIRYRDGNSLYRYLTAQRLVVRHPEQNCPSDF